MEKETEVKPNCYACVYRGTIPGDAHSCCHHPSVANADDNVFGAMAQMLCGEFSEAMQKLNIKGNATGVRGGWFMWPANFDPVWLESCSGFKRKESPKEE